MNISAGNLKQILNFLMDIIKGFNLFGSKDKVSRYVNDLLIYDYMKGLK